jgi:hypothetical protein
MTMTLNLNITTETLDKLTWEQWELFDTIGEKANYRKAREIVALFVDGMNVDEAMAALGKLKTSEMKAIIEQFATKMKELAGVNPQNGGS